jgi:hypothetical protein
MLIGGIMTQKQLIKALGLELSILLLYICNCKNEERCHKCVKAKELIDIAINEKEEE